MVGCHLSILLSSLWFWVNVYMSYQWYISGLFYANYLDSLPSPLGKCFSLGRQQFRLHFPLRYAVMGQEQWLQHTPTRSAIGLDQWQSLQDSFLYLVKQLWETVCLSTWMCVSDSRLWSSSPSLFWLDWMRFLTWN